MKRLFLLTGLFFFIYSLFAQIPSGYYDTATGTGYTLKTQLHNIIKNGHAAQAYGDLYAAYVNGDTDPEDGYVWDMYSENPEGTDPYNYSHGSEDQCGNYSVEGDCYNREHLFPQGIFSEASPMKTDYHHVVPSDGKVNGMRSSYPFGEVGSVSWTSLNGSKKGTSSYPGFSGTVFEPIDEYKGDISRSMLYFATRYEDKVSSWSHDMLNGTSDQVYADWFIALLLDWHNQDPVSQKEITRNDVGYTFQGNRNPFIDHPEYVAQIWGGSGNVLPVVSNITISPESPKSTDAVNVSASITDSDGSISSAQLHWGTSSGSLGNTITMSVSGGDIYTTNTAIPAQSDGTIIYYEIEATDNESGVTSSSENSYSVQDNPVITILEEDFSSCPADAWITYSVASNRDWTCGGGYESINAYDGDVASDDWLITPAQDLNSYNNEILKFDSWTRYTDASYPPIELLYSVNYSGSGDPTVATWETLSAVWSPENSQSWTGSGNIDISEINGSQVYFAFHYTSSGTGAGSSAQWEIDNVLITGVEATNEAPVISDIQMNPSQPDQYDDITFSATITDSDGTISSAVLKWGTTSGTYTNDIVMSNVGDVYSGTITAQVAGTEIYYIIEAHDNKDLSTRLNENAFTVVENQIPQISDITNTPAIPEETDDITISASITDADGTVSSATLKWGTTAGSYPNELTMNSAGDVYSEVITAQTGGTNIHYIIEATDDDGDQARSEEKSFTVNMAGNAVPVISNITFNPTAPTSSDSVIITATITDADGTNPAAKLKWGTSSYIHINQVDMTRDGDTYTDTIPAYPNETHIYFIIVADDSNGGVVESAQCDYIVDDPNVVPQIAAVNFDPLEPGRKDDVRVSATITDSDGTIVVSKIRWGTEPGVYTHTDTLIKESGDSFLGTIAAQPHGSHIYFVVYAEDNEGGIDESTEFDYVVDDPNMLPVISDVSFDPSEPESADEIRVSVTITDSDGTIVVSKILWGTESEVYTHTDTLTEESGNSFLGTIPAQPDGSHIYFVIFAEDDEGGSNESNEFDFLVDDLIAPEISNVSIDPTNPTDNDAVAVSATISDSDGSIASAELEWGLTAESLTNTINMSVSSGSVYITDSEIPAQASGETVYYRILTTDNDALETTYNGNYEVSESNSINGFLQKSLLIYPNPVKDFINIEIKNYSGEIEIIIYDVLGSVLLFEKNQFNNEYRINLSDLDSGIYFINFVSDNILITKKIVVKK